MRLPDEPFLRIRLRGSHAEVAGVQGMQLGQVRLPAALQTGRDVYAEWHWDGAEVLVRNCRLGYFPIYFYATENEFGVSPSVETLVAQGAPTHIDDAALAVYLRLGWTLGEDTVFRAIRALPPDATVRWSGGAPVITSGFAHPRPLAIDRAGAIDAFAELLRDAVRRRSGAGADEVMPLSGGRDSRSILFELQRQHRVPRLFVTNHDFPPYRRENIDVSRLLASRMGARHAAIGQPGSRLRCELLKNRLNNFGANENAWCVSLYEHLGREFRNPVVYEGSPGAASYGSYQDDDSMALLERGSYEQLAGRILDRWLGWQASEDALQRVMTTEASRRFSRDAAIARAARELERCASAANPLQAFYFWNRGRQVAALQPFSVARRLGVNAVTPYLDHELVDFLGALPPSVRIDKALHTAAIRRIYPEFDDIPFAGDLNTPIVDSNRHYRRLLVESMAYVGTHGDGRFVRRASLVRRLASFAVSGGNLRMRIRWTAPFAALYLVQLESLLGRAAQS